MITRDSFGRHVRSLRARRKLTQDVLATRAGLSADTVRRLEHGDFSPSLDTLIKLCSGLSISMSTLFAGFEQGFEAEPKRELLDLVLAQHPDVQVMALEVLRAFFVLQDSRNAR